MFDVIERLKADWTDKYVVIASPAPELARFARATGQVKTVNMNGRCLVEFDQYNNIGWYDIDPAALKIVPKPEPKPPEPKAEKAAKPTPAKPAPTAEKPAAAAKKPSTADILAAARGKGGAAPAAAKPAGTRPSTAESSRHEAARRRGCPGGRRARTGCGTGGGGHTRRDPEGQAGGRRQASRDDRRENCVVPDSRRKEVRDHRKASGGRWSSDRTRFRRNGA
ncbi:MAG: hypothetical protein EBR28_14100 [Planctomycetia bacterium]|nr:hypothetical protein [Planctomycetia bacterium]